MEIDELEKELSNEIFLFSELFAIEIDFIDFETWKSNFPKIYKTVLMSYQIIKKVKRQDDIFENKNSKKNNV